MVAAEAGWNAVPFIRRTGETNLVRRLEAALQVATADRTNQYVLAANTALGEIDLDTGAYPQAEQRLLTALDLCRASGSVVPALSVLGASAFAFRFELAVKSTAGWSPWIATTTVGSADFFPYPPVDGIESQIDVWTSRAAVGEIKLRVRVRGGDAAALFDRPWLVTLSVSDGSDVGRMAPAPEGSARLSVPALSQMEADPALASRICSPTSVAMVLGYLGVGVTPERLAADVFHPALDIYGVWPAAVSAAARRGIPGYLLRFPDWTAAAWCLDHGLPIIASVRYEAGELTGAAIAATTGHLVVLTGYTGPERTALITPVCRTPGAGTTHEIAYHPDVRRSCR